MEGIEREGLGRALMGIRGRLMQEEDCTWRRVWKKKSEDGGSEEVEEGHGS